MVFDGRQQHGSIKYMTKSQTRCGAATLHFVWYYFKMAYCVYKHTSPSGKVYIGVTGMGVKKRWANGKGYVNNRLFYRAVQKYGWDNITHEVLFDNLTKEEAYRLEQEAIKIYDSTNPEKGYNNSIGGVGGSLGAKLSEEAVKNIANGHKGLKPSAEMREKLRQSKLGEKNPNYGKKIPEDVKEKIRESQRKTFSDPDFKKKHSEKMKNVFANLPELKKETQRKNVWRKKLFLRY